jgi:hypothetical protein
VDIPARQAAADALIALSLSPDWSDRQDAGVALASFAESETVSARLRELVLDPEDSAVTRATVAALIHRRDAASLAVVAAALLSADDNTIDWMDTGARDALGMADWTWDEAVEVCRGLPDSAGQRALMDLLTSRQG